MKRFFIFCVLIRPVMFSCQSGEALTEDVLLKGNDLRAEFNGLRIKNAKAGIVLITGKEKREMEWYPEEMPEVINSDRMTPLGMASIGRP